MFFEAILSHYWTILSPSINTIADFIIQWAWIPLWAFAILNLRELSQTKKRLRKQIAKDMEDNMRYLRELEENLDEMALEEKTRLFKSLKYLQEAIEKNPISGDSIFDPVREWNEEFFIFMGTFEENLKLSNDAQRTVLDVVDLVRRVHESDKSKSATKF